MSKIETMQRYAREQTAQELQIVQSITALQMSMSELQSLPPLLRSLPSAIAQSAAPMQSALDTMSARLDETLTLQRSSLDQMSEQLTIKAAAAMRMQAETMNRDLQTIREHARTLIASLDTATDAAKTLRAQTAEVKSAHASMMQSAEALQTAAKAARSRGWISRLLGLITVALMSAAAVVTGGHALERHLDSDSVQTTEQARAWRVLQERATERERALLRQIVNRPAR